MFWRWWKLLPWSRWPSASWRCHNQVHWRRAQYHGKTWWQIDLRHQSRTIWFDPKAEIGFIEQGYAHGRAQAPNSSCVFKGAAHPQSATNPPLNSMRTKWRRKHELWKNCKWAIWEDVMKKVAYSCVVLTRHYLTILQEQWQETANVITISPRRQGHGCG